MIYHTRDREEAAQSKRKLILDKYYVRLLYYLQVTCNNI